ncbi:MAG: response regulator [Jatrophihabitans sp.]|uniref:response regulator n=1 Tax=Jatrophihabitans sp. TaxID=1932789 RepID=UPI003F7CF297
MTQAAGRDRQLTILLVEDDPGDVVIAEEALRAGRLASELTVARDGVDALARLGTDPAPDLILLDLNLPRLSGHEVLAEVKRDPRLRRIPVVVLSTSAVPEDVQRTYDLGGSAHVVKPVDFDEFARLVRRIEDFFSTVAERPGKPSA